MHTKRGYIVPIIIIFVLLMLAGLFIFAQKQVESPIVEDTTPSIPSIPLPIDISTTTTTSTDSNIQELEDQIIVGTTTATSSVELDIQ